LQPAVRDLVAKLPGSRHNLLRPLEPIARLVVQQSVPREVAIRALAHSVVRGLFLSVGDEICSAYNLDVKKDREADDVISYIINVTAFGFAKELYEWDEFQHVAATTSST
jgi:hypothetical protein